MNFTLTNARIVTPNTVFDGSLRIENGIIADIMPEKYFAEGVDLKGRWLTPGCIDIHSDYIEKELHPRPSASFSMPFAVQYMDARAASCGISTLFSALSFSDDESKHRRIDESIRLTHELDECRKHSLVRHYMHARMDPNSNSVIQQLPELKRLESMTLVVYNESIPGERQFTREYVIEQIIKGKGLSKEEAIHFLEEKVNRLRQINCRAEIKAAFETTHIIGSHDDTTEAHVEEAFAFGATLSEMPTTLVAARKAKELGMWVCMGAPNYYRGGSHCGNLACHEAMAEGLVDMLCSDYHFPALIGSFVKMIREGIHPSTAINYITLQPAKLLRLDNELGSIEIGKKADLISFDIQHDHALIYQLWIEGQLRYQTYYPS